MPHVRITRSVVLSVTMFLTACVIQGITGPTVCAPLSSVTYTISALGGSCPYYPQDFIASGVLVADIPSDWQFQSAQYDGAFAGIPSTGSGVLRPCNTIFSYPAPAPGFQRLCIAMESARHMTTGSYATIHASFRTGNTEGLFPLQFRVGAYSPNVVGGCVQQTATEYAVAVHAADAAPSVPSLSHLGLAVLAVFLGIAGLIALRSPHT